MFRVSSPLSLFVLVFSPFLVLVAPFVVVANGGWPKHWVVVVPVVLTFVVIVASGVGWVGWS
jgi:hypothetical protein